MPRTKVAKNAAKRVREVDEVYETKIKNFDTRVAFIFQDIDSQFGERYDKLDEILTQFRHKIPNAIKQMTIGDLKTMNLGTFAEVNDYLQSEANLNCTSLRVPRDDEGYLTEASSTSSRHTAQRTTIPKKASLMGPLSSARARSRRSRSADPLQTPSVLQSIRAKKPISAMKQAAAARQQAQQQQQQQAAHPHHSLDDSMSSTNSRVSRSKFRTPGGRTKAASADRIASITPKVQMGTPMAILRYARMGETLISAKGSPVAGVPAAIHDTANIAIPLADGVISMRPTSMGEFDRNLLHRIDAATLTQLKKLQDNLNQVIQGFDNKQF